MISALVAYAVATHRDRGLVWRLSDVARLVAAAVEEETGERVVITIHGADIADDGTMLEVEIAEPGRLVFGGVSLRLPKPFTDLRAQRAAIAALDALAVAL